MRKVEVGLTAEAPEAVVGFAFILPVEFMRPRVLGASSWSAYSTISAMRVLTSLRTRAAVRGLSGEKWREPFVCE